MVRSARYFIMIFLSGISVLAGAQEVPSRDAMEFDRNCIVTDTLKEDGGPYRFVYFWRNTSKETVTVLRVATSCGCVAPVSSDMRRVRPGDKDSLEVLYHTKGHPGPFSRRIFVYTDSGEEPSARLELRGYVAPAKRPVWNYPYAMGMLLAKQKKVKFSGRGKQVESILCFNAGDRPMRLSAVRELLPDWLDVRFEPETVEPSGETDMVVAFDPSCAPAELPESLTVLVEGPDVPPSSRMITVLFTE